MISKYKAVFFDLDDTLLNFKYAEVNSLKELITPYIDPNNFEAHLIAYRKISHKLWDAFEEGRGSKESIKTERFKRFFDYLNVKESPEKANESFFNGLAKHIQYMPNALGVVKEVKKRMPVYILTNGFEKVQKQRINNCELKDLISAIIVSESCGYQKPEKQIFDYALKLAKLSDPKEALIVGDKMQTDILGGHHAGWGTCWFNPSEKRNFLKNLNPTFEIKNLNQLL